MAARCMTRHFPLFISALCLFGAVLIAGTPAVDYETSDVSGAEERNTGSMELRIPVSPDLYPGHRSTEAEEGVRRKRSVPSGDGRQGAHHRQETRSFTGLTGDIVFSARRAFRLYFDFDYSALSVADILSAHVIIYQTRPRRMPRHNRKSHRTLAKSEVHAAKDAMDAPKRHRREAEERDLAKVKNKSARVIMHQTIDSGVDVGTTRAVDFRLVDARSRGWQAFDILPALKDWVADIASNQGLELWIVSSHAGRRAARTARSMKFVKPNSHRAIYRPELIVKLKPATSHGAGASAGA